MDTSTLPRKQDDQQRQLKQLFTPSQTKLLKARQVPSTWNPLSPNAVPKTTSDLPPQAPLPNVENPLNLKLSSNSTSIPPVAAMFVQIRLTLAKTSQKKAYWSCVRCEGSVSSYLPTYERWYGEV